MNNEQNPNSISKMENIAFYIFLITIILAPLSFFWSKFVSLDVIKSFVISTGTLVSAIFLAYSVMKSRSVSLPPKSLCRTSVLLVISIVISSIMSAHFIKSFFGYGFEVGNASFLIMMFVVACLTYKLVVNKNDRSILIYFGFISSYLVLFILHLLRTIFGSGFLTLGYLDSLTSTIFGNWYSLATFSSVIFLISFYAISYLGLKGKMKIANYILMAISVLGILFVADTRVWIVLSLVILLTLIVVGIEKYKKIRSQGSVGFFGAFIRSLNIFTLVVFVLSLVLVFWGPKIMGNMVQKLKIVNVEIFLPWQTTLDITSSSLQSFPLFGIGSNQFSQAYLAFKPMNINLTPVWATEFNYGIGLIPTFVSTHGIVGTILWILLFVFYGIIAVRVLKNIPEDKEKRFMLGSSLSIGVFLWLLSFVSVPSHSILFFNAIILAMFIALAVSYEILPNRKYTPSQNTLISKLFGTIVSIVILVLVIWVLFGAKKFIANSYLSKAIKYMNNVATLDKSEMAINTGLKFDKNDALWRVKAELSIVTAQKLGQTVNSSMSASTTQEILKQINNILNAGVQSAEMAIAYDKQYYYNYISEARVAEVASGIKMPNAYDIAVKAYNNAIATNPYNPSLYFGLANIEAQNSKYDDALKSLGKALQVKNNYLDAIYLLSQVYASKGDLQSAITASSVATQLDPKNPVLWFQSGLLKYNAKDFSGASEAFNFAIKYQPDYANAKYFLGLSEARQGKTANAITIFEELSKSAEGNQEIALILSNLRSGRSIFTDAKPPVTPSPEKRSTLPLKEKKQ